MNCKFLLYPDMTDLGTFSFALVPNCGDLIEINETKYVIQVRSFLAGSDVVSCWVALYE